MEKPRPSPNFGNTTSTRVARARRAAKAAGSSAGPSRSRPSGGGELSATTLRPLISAGIDLFLERLDADAAHDVDEALFLAFAALEVARDELLDDPRHLLAGDGAADHAAEGGARASLACPRFS